jgi:hypothetical protein
VYFSITISVQRDSLLTGENIYKSSISFTSTSRDTLHKKISNFPMFELSFCMLLTEIEEKNKKNIKIQKFTEPEK